MKMDRSVLPGQSFPLGATVCQDGVNFSVFSKNSYRVDLLLFDDVDGEPTEIINLDPNTNKTFYYWHALVPGLEPGQLYGYRVHGPFDPKSGYRFDGDKLLLDPYAKGVAVGNYQRQDAIEPGDNCRTAMKSVVVDPSDYDWEGDQPLNLPFAKSIIYEVHVGGFTKHPNSDLPPDLRGTFKGVIEKIPYLVDLGITTLELMPIQQFDPQDSINPSLNNYWGYSPIGLFAPHHEYGTNNDPIAVIKEFKDMVKALHKAGIEVLVDVVFNHTAEGHHLGPTLSFKGFENKAYYMLTPDNATYADFSGTGNTLNSNH